VARPGKPPAGHPGGRSPWLVPIIVCGALLLLVLLAVCAVAAGGGFD
jgi:hypothetical protein